MLDSAMIRALLSLTVVSSVVCDFKLLLLHTNDMHSRFKEVNKDTARCQQLSKKCYGGFARVRTAVENYKKEAKKKGMSVLYLDAGDIFHETVFYMEYKWNLAVKMMNLLRPDAMSLGNHEFDDGIEGLSPFVKGIQVPIVCCNIDTTEVPDLQIRNQLLPSKVFQFGKTKVGVVGYLTRDIPSKNLGKVKLLDEIACLQKEIERLKKDGVNIIIALGHSGYRKDKDIAGVEDVDLVVGGHSHAFLYSKGKSQESQISGKYPTIVTQKKTQKIVPVVQAFYGTKYLGHLELVFDDDGNLKSHKGSLVLLNGKIKQDKGILNELKPYSMAIENKYGRTIGHTKVLLKGTRVYCRTQECIIGNLVADAFVEYANNHFKDTHRENVAHIGLIESKAIKGSLIPKSGDYTGDITLEDVMVVLPYDRSLTVLRLKGGIIRQVLEAGVNKYDTTKGGLVGASLLQVSGIKVQINLKRDRGRRVTRVQVAPDYQDLRDEEVYNVVMTDYLANNKDDFPMLIGQPTIELPKHVRDYDVVAKYIEDHSPLEAMDYHVEGRINIIE